MIENLEEGHVYSVEWIDGYGIINCTFVKKHKGFVIFIDDKGLRVICRETSIRSIKKLDKK